MVHVRGIGGDVEAAVMDIAWSASKPLTVVEMWTALNAQPDRRELARTTVLTVMTNLAKKGLLTRHGTGRAHSYTAAVPRGQYTAELMTQALHSTDDRTAALLHFAEQLDDDERQALLAMARRRRRRP